MVESTGLHNNKRLRGEEEDLNNFLNRAEEQVAYQVSGNGYGGGDLEE